MKSSRFNEESSQLQRLRTIHQIFAASLMHEWNIQLAKQLRPALAS